MPDDVMDAELEAILDEAAEMLLLRHSPRIPITAPLPRDADQPANCGHCVQLFPCAPFRWAKARVGYPPATRKPPAGSTRAGEDG